MDFATFKCERVQGPEYGNAPAELVDEHKAIIAQMEQLCKDGVPLTSEQYLDLSERANDLSMKIDKYNAPPQAR